jgi:TrmH family RNA methyltransferase
MLSNNKIKLIKSLETKKHRDKTGFFVAEGDKMVYEMISSNFKVVYIAATEDWYLQNNHLIIKQYTEKDIVNKAELTKASLVKIPQDALCVVEIPHYKFDLPLLNNKLSIILDKVQDPGNFGTIIRIADWFGIEHIICSTDTVDLYNPKVVQSTMGAITRVKVMYNDLNEILAKIRQQGLSVFGTTLQGENIYECQLPSSGFIMLGNESKGINPEYQSYFKKELFIPNFSDQQKHSESLNVAVAAAIICSEFRRRI